MIWMLDTNIWIALLNGSDASLADCYRAKTPAVIVYPSIVRAELLYGAAKSKSKKKSQAAVSRILSPHHEIPFGGEAVSHYATIRSQLEGKGIPIGAEDYLVAATALATGAVLVTRNLKEFQRVPGLRTDAWKS
jgi:tRNA(fMet)-specific endonuclease VapC